MVLLVRKQKKKRNSSEVQKLQDILNKYFKRGKKELPKYFDKYMEEGEFNIRFPEVWDGATRRLCRHLDYDDLFICIPQTSIYYVINRDKLFGFEVTYGEAVLVLMYLVKKFKINLTFLVVKVLNSFMN